MRVRTDHLALDDDRGHRMDAEPESGAELKQVGNAPDSAFSKSKVLSDKEFPRANAVTQHLLRELGRA